jgi:3-dehydroquinate synthase
MEDSMSFNHTSSAISSVILQTGALAELDFHLSDLAKYSQLVLFSHPTLMSIYGSSILSSLKRLNRPILELSIPNGERSKSSTQAKRCWQEMFAKGIDRQAAIIAFGGGVICDLAGFVASCYMRGLDAFYLPSTLLAMVDAALGGKTGVNLPQAKNIIGTFHQPKQIIVDPACLITLPQREFNSGLAEIIKYGIISDPLLVNKLEEGLEKLKDRQGLLLEEIIQRCIAIKSEFIVEDEKDRLDKRAALNYGHTFGHAIEAVTGYRRYLHGEAIAMGMSCAVNISVQLGLCDSSLIARQDRLCQQAHLPTQLPRLSVEHLMTRMKSDKKAICGKINLILLEKIGKVVKVCDVNPMLIKQTLLAKMNKRS